MNTIADTFAGLASTAISLAATAPARILGGLMLAAALLLGIHTGMRHMVEDQAATAAQFAQLAR